ncbi:MAG TPA: YidC/Oxa1 family insertase periplasmic-domain containing protein [Thermoguttaceae bacterium]|nr:YidC/Oxa1 family insertase periplasmic-domain containing protein [Thermoguttaceae bacterium]
MERRFVLFLILSLAILLGHGWLMKQLGPQPGQQAQAPEGAEKDADGEAEPPEKTLEKPGDKTEEQPEEKTPEGEVEDKPAKEPAEVAAPEPQSADWIALGSADPNDPYRMQVVLTTRGAAVSRIDLNSNRYRDQENRSGFLGRLVIDGKAAEEAVQQEGKGGCPVQVDAYGSPAYAAGLRKGDLIVAVDGQPISGPESLDGALAATRPGDTVEVTYVRPSQREVAAGQPEAAPRDPDNPQEEQSEPITVNVELGHHPLALIRPEEGDPLSFLLTLRVIDGDNWEEHFSADTPDVDGRPHYVGLELPGLKMLTADWQMDEGADQTRVTFLHRLPERGLEVTKTYRLEKASDEQDPEKANEDLNYRAYHLVLDIGIRSIDGKDHVVAYQLDGPTGLPTEGFWYANKVGRRMFKGVGLRDFVISKQPGTFDMIGCPKIAEDDTGVPGEGEVTFIGVDAQYFSCILIPKGEDNQFAVWRPTRVGPKRERVSLTDTSCRLVSHEFTVKGDDLEGVARRFEIFAGPKRPDLLAEYGLGDLVYYGWFSWAARPMVWILHQFYAVVQNYGLAILLLTVLVRGCMFPLGRKQALGAQKMQQLQPEIKKIQEKYKKDLEARTKAQQDLFRKHNYNPLSGCLVLFIQLPIFIALYRALMVDVELRQAPLIAQSIRWCSNLAAPDMLFDWGRWPFVPNFIVNWCPYFNLLPILTIILFIVQQKMFMPPPVDEQAAMQQKIMKFMMVFIGFLFFKVASGLCLYFICSSLWGLAERKFLPKHAPAGQASQPQSRAEAKAQAKPQPKPAAKPGSPSAASGRDGAAGSKKKHKKSRGRK